MKRLILLTFIIFILGIFSCTNNPTENVKVPERVWIYIVFNLLESDSTDVLYSYYGTVEEQDYINLAKNTLEKQFLILNDIRFDAENGKLTIYENEFEADEFLINKETIRGIDLLKADPILYYEDEELDENALKFKRGMRVSLDTSSKI